MKNQVNKSYKSFKWIAFYSFLSLRYVLKMIETKRKLHTCFVLVSAYSCRFVMSIPSFSPVRPLETLISDFIPFSCFLLIQQIHDFPILVLDYRWPTIIVRKRNRFFVNFFFSLLNQINWFYAHFSEISLRIYVMNFPKNEKKKFPHQIIKKRKKKCSFLVMLCTLNCKNKSLKLLILFTTTTQFTYTHEYIWSIKNKTGKNERKKRKICPIRATQTMYQNQLIADAG